MTLYTIKPLEWKPGKNKNEVTAKTLFGKIVVWKWVNGWAWAGDNLSGKNCRSLADGQAQAEACWQARLAGVLEEQR